MLEFAHPDDSPVTYWESAVGVRREENAEPVATVQQLFDSIHTAALDTEESRTFIERFVQ